MRTNILAQPSPAVVWRNLATMPSLFAPRQSTQRVTRGATYEGARAAGDAPRAAPLGPAAPRNVAPARRCLADDLQALRDEVRQVRRENWLPWVLYWLASTGQAMGLGAALVGLFVLCSPPNVAAIPVALLGVYYGMRLYHYAQGYVSMHRAVLDGNEVSLAEKRGRIAMGEQILAQRRQENA